MSADDEDQPQDRVIDGESAVRALGDLRGRIERKEREVKGLRARRDAIIARAVKNGWLSERDSAEAAGVAPSYAHRAATGKTGATATLKKKKMRGR